MACLKCASDKFNVNASGHPFQIRVSSGGSAYSDGVVNNGAQVGSVFFTPDMDAPNSLVYQCTNHAGMVGDIVIVDNALFAAASHNQAWSTITSTPTTISGYGITDAFDGAYGSLSGVPSTFTPASHNQAWSTITSTPTTRSGYGITDAQATLVSGTNIKTVNGTPYALNRHMRRALDAGARNNVEIPKEDRVRVAIESLLKEVPHPIGRLRLLFKQDGTFIATHDPYVELIHHLDL